MSGFAIYLWFSGVAQVRGGLGSPPCGLPMWPIFRQHSAERCVATPEPLSSVCEPPLPHPSWATRRGRRDGLTQHDGAAVRGDPAAAGGGPRACARSPERSAVRALRCVKCAMARESRPMRRKALTDPLWMRQLEWPTIIHDLGLGHPLKFLWEEKAQHLTTYPNFWKQFYRKFPQYRQASVTAREFEPGERVEVDYAGDPIEWVELEDRGDPQGVCVCRWSRLQPTAVCMGGRGHEEPQLARLLIGVCSPFTAAWRT